MTNNIIKPFLKWIGGKTQIIDTIINNYPKKINNYHDIFLGGGSTLFALLSYINDGKIEVIGDIYAYDINKELISVYKNIQKHPKKLYKKTKNIVDEYNSITNNILNRHPTNIDEAKTSKESYYYWIRNKYNNLNDKCSVKGSAMFIFLNKTCFRGMYRCGPNGFNVPYGHYANPKIIDKKEILNISNLIQSVKFRHMSFEKSLLRINKNDFAYLDPPYAPENNKSFVGYNADGFNLEQHKKLFNICDNMRLNKINFMMSNSNVELVINSFPINNYKIDVIECRRAINAKNPAKKTNEVIIKPK